MMASNKGKNYQSGITILELMIGMVVGFIVLAGILFVFVNTVVSSRDILNSARLNQDLSAMMSIISGEVRRAGHWVQSASAANSPYTDIGMDINVVNGGGVSCVLYNYDEDNNGEILNDDEYGGFRISNDAVWGRVSGASMSDCAAGQWNRISDENFMTIDTATSGFVDESFCIIDGAASTGCPSTLGGSEVAGVRYIRITLAASVNSDPDWQKTVQESVKIRNDFLQ